MEPHGAEDPEVWVGDSVGVVNGDFEMASMQSLCFTDLVCMDLL